MKVIRHGEFILMAHSTPLNLGGRRRLR
jgi:hypothetical protein